MKDHKGSRRKGENMTKIREPFTIAGLRCMV
jgi:hypothetical protein